jgi:hypothetical protein
VLRVLTILIALGGVAHARATSELPYALPETYSAALRFVRVDKGCKITDKDPDAAFVTFVCEEDDKHARRGAIEIIASKKDGVKLQVVLGDDPHYVELRWAELIERKLRDERGTPPPIKKEPDPPPQKPKDGGT